MRRVIYVKALTAGLLAGIVAILIQAVLFSRFEMFNDGSSGSVSMPTRVYGAPVVAASIVGSLAAWWRLRGR